MDVALVLRWLAGALLLGAVALPLSAWLFAPTASRGAGFAFALATAVVTLVTFWVGHLSFGVGTLVVPLALLAAGSAMALRAGVTVPTRRFAEAGAVLAVAFLLAVRIRAADPSLEIWAEGALNFGLLKSLLRAGALPPADMWYAGHPVQYYYGGHLAIAAWTLATATPPSLAPNLAVPLFYAMLVVGAYDLGGSVGAARGHGRRVTGALTALLVGLGGNLYEPIRGLVGALPAGPARTLRETLGLAADGLAGPFAAGEATHFATFPTDVPLYSVRIGSFHAHVLSQPYTLLAAGLLFAAVQAEGRRARAVRLAAVAPVAGLVALTNAWSLPAVAGVAALAVAFAPAHPASLVDRAVPDGPVRRELGRYVGGGLAGVGVAAAGVAFAAPFVLGTDVTRPLRGVHPAWRTPAATYVVQYGAILLAFALALVPRLGHRARGALLGAVAAFALVPFAPGVAALAFVAPVLAVAWWLTRRDPDVGYLGVLVLAGAGLLLLVELVYLRGGAAFGRYNTVYKVSSQVWLFWSAAAGVALSGVLVRGVRRAPSLATGRAVVAAALVCTTLVYGGLVVTETTVDGPEKSLDATAYLDTWHPDYAGAIDYLDARPGQPHVVEAAVPESVMFTFRAAPVSSFTGLPTIAGWTHAADYHSEAGFARRADEVRRIYEGGPATRHALLDRYDVRFVVLGPHERSRYDVADFGADPRLTRVGSWGDVTVYAVAAG